MKTHPFLFAVAALAALTCLPMASRASEDLVLPSIVTPDDTFNISVAGFSSTDNSGVYLVTPITATFNGLGTLGAQTFGGYALGGQNVTVTTTEAISDGNITDSIFLSVPTNFIPAGTTTNTGAVINEIELDMGNYNAGTNTLDFTPAITGTPTYTYSTQFAVSNTVGIFNHATLTNGNTSLYYYEGNSTTNPGGFSQFAPSAFGFSMTYAVPEPSTYALCALGLAGGATVLLRRRRTACA